jgi:preprotein translocase subunit SecE
LGALCSIARLCAPLLLVAASGRNWNWEGHGMARYNPVEFVNEVRHEVSKVTWPTLREVWITTLLVGLMVTVAAIFFLLADQVLGTLVKVILGLGR